MSELTAVDILIDPDEAAIERARDINARLLKAMPSGWALDETHVPHITTLQRYVRTHDLAPFAESVANVIAHTDMTTLSYDAVKITHADWGFPGYGPTVLLLQVSAAVLAPIIEWVEKFVPAQIGEDNYLPHLTLGVDMFDDLKVLEAEPFDTFPVRPSAVAIYQLGNNGTARVELSHWPLPDAG